jgi:hypothetical protein
VAVEKKGGRRVPYPGYFAECAETIDFTRVGGNSYLKVWGKCAEGIGTEGLRRNWKALGGRMDGVSARISFAIHGRG